MNYLDQQGMRSHVTILGWLLIAGHVILALVGGFVLVLLAGIGVASGDAQAATILSIVGSCVGLFLVVIAVPGIVAGYGLLQRRSWGRILALIVGILGLPSFPLGTLVGLYALWVLMQNAAADYFAAGQTA